MIAFVVKRHRLEAEDGFAGSVHRFNFLLEPPRRAYRAELTGGVDHHVDGVRDSCCHLTDAGDKATVLEDTDASSVGFASYTVVGNSDIEYAGGEIMTAVDCDVIGATGIVIERLIANRRVSGADRVVDECFITGRRIAVAGGVALERAKTVRRVVVAKL